MLEGVLDSTATTGRTFIVEKVAVLPAIKERRNKAHLHLLERKSKVYKAFLDMERAAFDDTILPKKVNELIANGISVVID